MSTLSTTPGAHRPPLPSNGRQRIALALVTLPLLALILSGWRYYHRLIPITIVVDGQAQAVQTTSRSATEALRELGYTPHPNDFLALPPGPLQPGARLVIERARPLLIDADGQTQAAWVRAETVGEALRMAGVTVGWRDEIILAGHSVDADAPLPPVQWRQPSDDLFSLPWRRHAQPLQIALHRAVPFLLSDGNAIPATIYTRAATVAEALSAENVPVYEGDKVFPALDSAIRPGLHVVIQRATPITIAVDGRTLAIRTQEKTVGAALAREGIVFMGKDQVEPALDTPLRPRLAIRVTRVQEIYVYEEELVPFETVMAPDDEILIDERRVKTQGHNGVRRYRYRVRYEDGREVERTLEDSWIAVEPENRIIAYGRKIIPRTLETPDGPITYWRKIRMYATSYSPRRSGTPRSAPWYGRTRLGMTLRKGIVAVDPGVVNMSQKLYVPGYGKAIAGDTGSGVKGKHIDLGYSDNDYVSWHWWTDVYLLWPPPPPYAIRYVLPNWPQYPDRRR